MKMQMKKIALGLAAVAVGAGGGAIAADPWTITTTVQVFQGYSTQPQKSPGGQGTSSITTITKSFNCPSGGKGNSCGNANPNSGTTTVIYEGPGNSPAEKIFTNQGR